MRVAKNKMIAHYILHVDNLAYQALLLHCATSGVYAQFSDAELFKMQQALGRKIDIMNFMVSNCDQQCTKNREFEKLFLEIGYSKLTQVVKKKPLGSY